MLVSLIKTNWMRFELLIPICPIPSSNCWWSHSPSLSPLFYSVWQKEMRTPSVPSGLLLDTSSRTGSACLNRMPINKSWKKSLKTLDIAIQNSRIAMNYHKDPSTQGNIYYLSYKITILHPKFIYQFQIYSHEQLDFSGKFTPLTPEVRKKAIH